MTTQVVITAVGSISPFGVGRELLWEGLTGGTTAVGPITLFDPPGPGSGWAGEVRDYDPAELLGPKGLRLLDRHTRLTLGAARLALDEGNLEGSSPRIGMVLGAAVGCLTSRLEFSLSTLRDGFVGVNPAFFPNTVANSSASQAAIRFGLQGPNATISTGMTSGLAAVAFATEAIQDGHADAILAGGAEELSPLGYAALHRTGLLCASGRTAPFDQDRDGAMLGEGAALLLLECAERARVRGARPLADLAGAAATTDHEARDRYGQKGEGLARAIRLALDRAGLEPRDVDLTVCGASGSRAGDLGEARGIHAGLGAPPDLPLVTAPKGALGESCSAGAAFQLATAVACLEQGIVLPTAGIQTPDPRCPVRVITSPQPARINHVLVTSVSPTCHSAAMVLSRPEPEGAEDVRS